MNFSDKVRSIVNSIVLAETEAAECRMECDRRGQAKAEDEVNVLIKELNDLLQEVDKLQGCANEKAAARTKTAINASERMEEYYGE